MSEPDLTTIAIQYTLSAQMPRYARERIMEAYARLLQVISLADGLKEPAPSWPVIRTMPALTGWDRARVLQQLEEASNRVMSVDDSLPDSLIATAQALGLYPHELGIWIYESGHEWQPGQLTAWSKRNGFGTNVAA